MPHDFPDLESLKELSNQLKVYPKSSESEQEFRNRFAKAVLRVYDSPVLATEIIIGKGWDKFVHDEEGRRIFREVHKLQARSKEAKFKSKRDTYFSIPWKEYEAVLRENEFNKIFSYNYQDRFGTPKTEEFAIWVEYQKALFLNTNSYIGMSKVASAELHYELNVPNYKLKKSRKTKGPTKLDELFIHGGNHKWVPNKDGKSSTCIVGKDAREGLIGYIRKLEESGCETNNPWRYFDEHNLCLCDGGEKGVEGYNWDNCKEVMKKKIDSLPREVKSMLGAR